MDTLTARVEGCEKNEGSSVNLTALKANNTGLRKDVDELKSTDITSLWDNVDSPENRVIEFLSATVTGDDGTIIVVEPIIDVEDADSQIDEEALGVTEDAIVQVATVEFLCDTSMIGSSGPKPT